MSTVLLVRHAITEDTGKRLYGRQPGVHLSERGRTQADELAARLGKLPLAAVYSSPLERCVETAEPTARARGLEVLRDPGLAETDVGRWTGRTFGSLARTRAWRRVRFLPSAARFPDGESLSEVQHRTVAALDVIARRHPRDVVAAFSHGDPIRLALAYFAGLPLDLFSRLEVAAASVSAVALSDGPPRVVRVSDTGSLDDLVPRGTRRR
jgi:probable phosphomutase (TIGR03848 family)